MERYTKLFQEALVEAQSMALVKDNQFIEPVHVGKVMLNQTHGSIAPLLTRAGVDQSKLIDQLDQAIEKLPQVSGGSGDIYPSRDLTRLLNQCVKLADQYKDQYISSELFVLAALEQSSDVLGKLLKQAGVDIEKYKRAMQDMRGGDSVNDPQCGRNATGFG